ncbi:MAG: serine--tRNA ligase [Sphingobacteriales bacterium]|nr:serine--tRNA ligase [Sphingobacteriales bacterium]
MLELAAIRANPEAIKQGLAVKRFAPLSLIDDIVAADEQRRKLQQQSDDLLNRQNTLSKEIGNLYKQGKTAEANEAKAQTTALKEDSQALQQQLAESETYLNELLIQLPNLPHASVPKGAHTEDNLEEYRHGTIPTLHEGALPHWELTDRYDLMSLELGVKITGAGFPVYKGKGARLQRALIAFFLDEATRAGYTEILPPHLVNADSAYATGQLPDKEGQMYHVGIDGLYLIPTAEVPLTNIYRDVILKEEELPIKIAGYTPCFRREAGSYGAHVRGLNRVHQFDKVEIVQIAHPDHSYEVLEKMKSHVAGLLEKLELPYRVLRLCGGDMSFASALTFDFEVYSAAQERWLEVSSVSNFETYQANRLKLRFRDTETKKNRLAHTLNGSALALARIVAALLENNQTPNGIHIPKALQAYTGFDQIS